MAQLDSHLRIVLRLSLSLHVVWIVLGLSLLAGNMFMLSNYVSFVVELY